MNTAIELELLKRKLAQAEIFDVTVTDDALIVDSVDGRTISAPILWFPRLAYASVAERNQFILSRDGIHWPALDEDISVQTLLLGKGVGQSRQSLQRWLEQRQPVHENGVVPVSA
jgi:hypothetical protein